MGGGGWGCRARFGGWGGGRVIRNDEAVLETRVLCVNGQIMC